MQLYTFFSVSNIIIQFLRFEFINVILFDAIGLFLDNGKGSDVYV